MKNLPVLYTLPLWKLVKGSGRNSIYYYYPPENIWINGHKLRRFLKLRGMELIDYSNRWFYNILVQSQRPKCPICGGLMPFKGLWYNKDYCSPKCQIKAQTGRKQSDELRIKRAEAMRKPEVRLKNSESHKGLKLPQYLKDKLSRIRKELWKNPSEAQLKSIRSLNLYSRGRKSEVYFNGKLIMLDSNYELRIFNKLILDDNVIDIIREPFVIKYIDPIDGTLRRYYPDFKVIYKNGDEIIIEVKPIYLCNDLKVISKALSCSKYCKLNNMKYVIINEDYIFRDDTKGWIEY